MGWEAVLYFVRVGNIVTLWGQYQGVEGVATPIITDKIPMGYRPAFQPLTNVFLIDENTGAIADTTLVMVDGDTLILPLEENPAGQYYMATAVYVTFDDPPESDIYEP